MRLPGFAQARGGAVAAATALALPVIVGAAGLAIDVGAWYESRRTTQSSADAAAYAAAIDLARQGLTTTADKAALKTAAEDAAGRDAFDGTMTINNPPTSGMLQGNAAAIEVILETPSPLYFADLFTDPSPIRARAVAKAIVADACVWALHPTERGAMTVSGGAEVDLGCGVVVQSDHAEAALDQSGTGCLRSTSIAVAGGAEASCIDPQAEEHTAAFGDPFAGLAPPTYGSCDYNNKVKLNDGTATTVNLTPGVYCGGIDMQSAHVIFEPGLYVLDGGDLSVSAQAIVGNMENSFGGVSFYLTGSGNKYASVDIAGGAQVTLTPMTSGPLAEVLFFQDPAAPANATNKLAGGSTMDLTGILYFPSQGLEFAGGSSADEAEVLIAASTVKFTGAAHISSGYAADRLPRQTYARLVE